MKSCNWSIKKKNLPKGRQEYTIIMQNIRYSFKSSVIVRVLLLEVSNDISSTAL